MVTLATHFNLATAKAAGKMAGRVNRHNRPTDICTDICSKCRKHQVQIQNRLSKSAQHQLRTAALPLLGGARFASKGAIIQASLARPASAAKPFRWGATRSCASSCCDCNITSLTAILQDVTRHSAAGIPSKRASRKWGAKPSIKVSLTRTWVAVKSQEETVSASIRRLGAGMVWHG